MSLKAKFIPFLASGLCLTAIGVCGIIAGKASVSPPTLIAVVEQGQASANSHDAIPMLPLVTVTAQAPLPILPPVIVRASAAERLAAVPRDTRADSPIVAETGGSGGNVDLPHVHLDMPYYSFGKVLPRISKE